MESDKCYGIRKTERGVGNQEWWGDSGGINKSYSDAQKAASEKRLKGSEEGGPVLFDSVIGRGKGYWLILLGVLGKEQRGQCGWRRESAGERGES